MQLERGESAKWLEASQETFQDEVSVSAKPIAYKEQENDSEMDQNADNLLEGNSNNNPEASATDIVESSGEVISTVKNADILESQNAEDSAEKVAENIEGGDEEEVTTTTVLIDWSSGSFWFCVRRLWLFPIKKDLAFLSMYSTNISDSKLQQPFGAKNCLKSAKQWMKIWLKLWNHWGFNRGNTMDIILSG